MIMKQTSLLCLTDFIVGLMSSQRCSNKNFLKKLSDIMGSKVLKETSSCKKQDHCEKDYKTIED